MDKKITVKLRAVDFCGADKFHKVAEAIARAMAEAERIKRRGSLAQSICDVCKGHDAKDVKRAMREAARRLDL